MADHYREIVQQAHQCDDRFRMLPNLTFLIANLAGR